MNDVSGLVAHAEVCHLVGRCICSHNILYFINNLLFIYILWAIWSHTSNNFFLHCRITRWFYSEKQAPSHINISFNCQSITSYSGRSYCLIFYEWYWFLTISESIWYGNSITELYSSIPYEIRNTTILCCVHLFIFL